MVRRVRTASGSGRCCTLAFVIAVAGAGAGARGAIAAEAPAEPDPQQSLDTVFGEVIDVRVIDLQAVVTDRRGDRVDGLGPGDFRLRVDGREVPIEFFSEVRGGRALGVAEAAGPVAAAPAAPAGEEVSVNYLVFLDDVFTLGRDRDRSVRALAGGIDALRPGDRMAVVVYGRDGLEVLTPWTDSPSVLRGALRSIEERSATGLLRFATYKQLADTVPAGMGCALLRLGAVEGAPAAGDVGSALRRGARDEAWLDRVVAAAAASMRAFDDRPGRKVMVMLAGGWRPDTMLAFQGLALTDPHRFSTVFGPLTDTANLLGYSIYPVDVAGQVTTSGVDVEAGAGGGGASPFHYNRVLDDNLRWVAERTGGRALLDRERFAPLPLVAEDAESFYWLGFTPPRIGDERRHRIELEAIGPGLDVRTRRDFRDLSPFARTAALVESALMFGHLPAAGDIEVTVGEPLFQGRAMEVPIEVEIPLAEVVALPSGAGARVLLEVLVAAEDDKGRRSEVVAKPIELVLDRAPVPGETARYRTRLGLRSRPHELLVAVHDPLAARTLFGRAGVALR